MGTLVWCLLTMVGSLGMNIWDDDDALPLEEEEDFGAVDDAQDGANDDKWFQSWRLLHASGTLHARINHCRLQKNLAMALLHYLEAAICNKTTWAEVESDHVEEFQQRKQPFAL